MPLVAVKTKFQVTIPQALRDELGLVEGDLLEAKVENGKIVLTPKELVDRQEAVQRWRVVAAEARKRWEAEGKSEEDMERLINETVEEVRGELYAKPQANR